MSLTEPALPPISLEIKPRGSKGFKSIRNIVWNDIPEFAVLTGRNGSGKSQLLLYLAHAFNEASLQEIVSYIRGEIEAKLPNLTGTELQPCTIEFTNGRRVQYPAWMIDRRGHDLFQIFQAAFGGPSVVSPPRLRRSLQRVRLIPKELAQLFAQLQDG